MGTLFSGRSNISSTDINCTISNYGNMCDSVFPSHLANSLFIIQMLHC